MKHLTDRMLLAMISSKTFETPADICKRARLQSVNGMLGRLHRAGMIERIPTKRCYLYRSRQGRLV